MSTKFCCYPSRPGFHPEVLPAFLLKGRVIIIECWKHAHIPATRHWHNHLSACLYFIKWNRKGTCINNKYFDEVICENSYPTIFFLLFKKKNHRTLDLPVPTIQAMRILSIHFKAVNSSSIIVIDAYSFKYAL